MIVGPIGKAEKQNKFEVELADLTNVTCRSAHFCCFEKNRRNLCKDPSFTAGKM